VASEKASIQGGKEKVFMEFPKRMTGSIRGWEGQRIFPILPQEDRPQQGKALGGKKERIRNQTV